MGSNLSDDVKDELASTARWRREKAQEFARDSRNHVAVELCEILMSQTPTSAVVQKYKSLCQAFEAVLTDEDAAYELLGNLNEFQSATFRSIGFSFHPDHIDEVYSALCRDVESALRDANA